MKEGDKFEVVEDSVGFNIGTTVTFIREDEHGEHIMAWFKGVTKFGRVDEWPVILTKVVPYEDGRTILVSFEETTPTTKALYGEEEEEVDKYATCEERGWKEGDLFTYISDDGAFPEGDIIELINDDGTYMPLFRSVESGNKYFVYTFEVEPYVSPVEDEDMVNSPSHYNSGDIECIDAIEAALTPEEFVGYLKGNQLKYIWRMGKKGDAAQDLDKSMWYGRKLMETINEI